MARYTRKEPAPLSRDYRAFRADVREDFRYECAYCFVPELYAAGREAMELDHFRPQSRYPELVSTYGNIYYACRPCNGRKSDQWPSDEEAAVGYGFVDSCRDRGSAQYEIDGEGRLLPLTKLALYTIKKCRLNRDHLCQIRLMLMEDGEFAL